MTNELQIFYLHFLEIVVLVYPESNISIYWPWFRVYTFYGLATYKVYITKIFHMIYLKNRSYVTRLKLIHHVHISSLEHLQEYFKNWLSKSLESYLHKSFFLYLLLFNCFSIYHMHYRGSVSFFIFSY